MTFPLDFGFIPNRTHKLPPGITGDAVTRFLELPAG